MSPATAAIAAERQAAAARAVLAGGGRLDRARPVGIDILAVPLDAPGGKAAVTAWFADTRGLS
ncbi:hypothetical protein ABTB83_19545, partial [Acinetobacter baumannii]